MGYVVRDSGDQRLGGRIRGRRRGEGDISERDGESIGVGLVGVGRFCRWCKPLSMTARSSVRPTRCYACCPEAEVIA